MTVENYISFVERLDYYLELDMQNGGYDIYGHPVGLLEDVKICGVHYESYDKLLAAWNKRKERVNYDDLMLVASDEFIKSNDEMRRFNCIELPKVCFVSNKNMLQYPWQVYLPGFESEGQIGDSMVYRDFMGRRINEKYFNFIYWLNHKEIKRKI